MSDYHYFKLVKYSNIPNPHHLDDTGAGIIKRIIITIRQTELKSVLLELLSYVLR